MTVVDPPRTVPRTDDAQLLFQEAKQRRKRRWLISGITTLVLLVLIVVSLGLTSGGGGGGLPTPVVVPLSAGVTGHPAVNLSFRPVLCYAPPLTLAEGQVASTGSLPACSAATELTTSNLQVTPDSSNVTGYTSNGNVPADPQFATYPSTATSRAGQNDVVLLPGVAAVGSGRYVLGPASLTQRGVKSASARMIDGQWTIDLILTPAGSAAWDTLTKQQFHQIIGIDLNGRVISAPITMPTQTTWTSFDGRIQISGAFTGQKARAIAAEL
jgi:preprotein translocase subunit SecD